jgi:hypothetical protein
VACTTDPNSIPALVGSAEQAKKAGLVHCLGCSFEFYQTVDACPKCSKARSAHYVLPVIHYLDAQTAIEQADVAFAAGADGIFLISHHSSDDDLIMPAMTIKGRYPDKAIGINFLSKKALPALQIVIDLGLDMIWTDTPGVTSKKTTEDARAIAQILAAPGKKPVFFGSVAFKYQAHEQFPGAAAHAASDLGMLATTSGSGTGSAPEVDKISSMYAAVAAAGKPELAIASGLTPENIASFAPYATHFLVATGVSTDEHHFDPDRLAAFVREVRAQSAAA